eukprot:XP_001701964.1 predicted protein [Chlamydomonas reinhardtii]
MCGGYGTRRRAWRRGAALRVPRAAALGIAGGTASPGALSSGSGSGPGSAEVSPTAAAAAVAVGAGGIAGHDTGSDDDHLHHAHEHEGECEAGEGEVEPSGKSLWGKARAATALVRLRQEAAARAAAEAAAAGAARNKLEYVPQPPARRPRGMAIGSPPVLAAGASAASVGLSGPMSADRVLAPHGTPAAAAAAAAAAQMAAAAGLQGAGSYQRPLGVESSEPLLHRAEAVACPRGHGPPHGPQLHPQHQPHLHSPQATAAQRAEAFLRARAQSERFRSPGAARWDLSPPPAPVAPLPLAFTGTAPYQSPHAEASLGSEYSGLSGVSGGRTPAPVPEHIIRPQHLHHRPPAHAATSSGMLQASRVEQLLPYHQQPQQQPQPRKSLQPRDPAKDTPTKTVSMGRSAREYWALKAQLQELDAQRTPSQRFAEEEAVRRRDRRREMGYTSSSSSSSDGEDGQPRLTQLQKLIARRRNTADSGTMPDAAATLAAIQAIAALGGGGGDGAAAGEAAAAAAGADAGVEGARGTLWSLYPKAAKAASLKAGPSRGSLMGGTTAPPERITPSRRQTTTADGAAAAAAAAAAGYYTSNSNSNSGAHELIGPGSAPPVLTPLAASILAAAGVPSSAAAAAAAAQHPHPHPHPYQQHPPPHQHGFYLQPAYYAGGGGVPAAAAPPPPGSLAAPSSMEVWAALQALAEPPLAPESSVASYPDPRPAVPVMLGPMFAPPGQPYPGLVMGGAGLPAGGSGAPGVGYYHPGTGPGSAPATRQRNSLSVPDAGAYGGSGGGSPRAAAVAAAAAAGGGGHLTWQQQLLEQRREVEMAEAAQRQHQQHQQHQQQQHYMQAAAFAGADGDGGGNGGGGGGWGAARFAPGAVAGYRDGDVEGGRSSAPTSSATARVQLWRAGGLGGSGHYGKYLGPGMAAEALAAAGAGGGGGGGGGGSNSFRGGHSPLHSPRVHPLPRAPGGAADGGGGGGGGAAAAGSRYVSDTGSGGNTGMYDNALYDDDRRPVDPAAHEQQRRQQQRQQQDAAWCAAAAVAAAESHDVFGSSGGGAGGHGGRGPAPQGFVPYDAQGLAEDGQPSPALAAAAAAALAEDEDRMSAASSPQRQWVPLQHAPQSAQGSSVTVSGGRGVAPGVAPGAGAGTAAGEDAGGAGPGAAPQPQPWEARRRLGPAPPSGGGALPESESAEFLAVLEKAALVSTKVAAAVAAGELG